jgi:hypothetical protein
VAYPVAALQRSTAPSAMQTRVTRTRLAGGNGTGGAASPWHRGRPGKADA